MHRPACCKRWGLGAVRAVAHKRSGRSCLVLRAISRSARRISIVDVEDDLPRSIGLLFPEAACASRCDVPDVAADLSARDAVPASVPSKNVGRIMLRRASHVGTRLARRCSYKYLARVEPALLPRPISREHPELRDVRDRLAALRATPQRRRRRMLVIADRCSASEPQTPTRASHRSIELRRNVQNGENARTILRRSWHIHLAD